VELYFNTVFLAKTFNHPIFNACELKINIQGLNKIGSWDKTQNMKNQMKREDFSALKDFVKSTFNVSSA